MKRAAILAGIVTVIIAGVFWRNGTFQTTEPSGEPIVSIKIPALSAAEVEGENIFNRFCAECHGQNAVGQDGVAPPLVHPIYEPNHHGDIAFVRAAKLGVRQHHWPFGDMAPIEGVTENDVDKVVAYIRTLQRANGIE